MLIAIGRATAREGCREHLVSTTRRTAEATRTDAGCELYSFAVDVGDPDVVLSVEVWRDRRSLYDHMAHDHTRDFLSEVNDLVADTPSMSFFEAQPVDFGGQEDTEGAR